MIFVHISKKIHHQKENFSLYKFYIKHFFIKSFLFRVNSVYKYPASISEMLKKNLEGGGDIRKRKSGMLRVKDGLVYLICNIF